MKEQKHERNLKISSPVETLINFNIKSWRSIYLKMVKKFSALLESCKVTHAALIRLFAN